VSGRVWRWGGAAALALLAGGPAAGAPAPATAVPFPAAAPAAALPRSEQLRVTKADRQQFIARAEQTIRAVQAVTEDYRKYVTNVQKTLATCQVTADREGLQGHPFRTVLTAEETQCQTDVVAFKQQAAAYVRELDAAAELARQTREAADSAQHQLERIRLMEHSLQLEAAVKEGLRTVETAKTAMQPWMTR
jgi:hypothetical protein